MNLLLPHDLYPGRHLITTLRLVGLDLIHGGVLETIPTLVQLKPEARYESWLRLFLLLCGEGSMLFEVSSAVLHLEMLIGTGSRVIYDLRYSMMAFGCIGGIYPGKHWRCICILAWLMDGYHYWRTVGRWLGLASVLRTLNIARVHYAIQFLSPWLIAVL
jgi:hypothetical protein